MHGILTNVKGSVLHIDTRLGQGVWGKRTSNSSGPMALAIMGDPDAEGRMTQITYDDGTFESLSYSCCGLDVTAFSLIVSGVNS